MTKLLRLTPVLVMALALLGATAAQAGKQAICHFPPGNPDNFHTIMVSDKAVAKHVEKHNDLIGSCLANCETICDDGDFCTQDLVADPDQCICLAEPLPPVDCDDSNDCTADSCDSDIGACLNNAEILDGEVCNDNDPDTTGEVCSAGVCAPPPPPGCTGLHIPGFAQCTVVCEGQTAGFQTFPSQGSAQADSAYANDFCATEFGDALENCECSPPPP